MGNLESAAQVIWLCRHGNRIDFIDPSYQGTNPHLSPDGVIQAKETGLRLRDEGIQHIFASPFLRTVETAYHIAEALDVMVKVEYGASEWLNKDWFTAFPEQIPLNELAERFPRIDLCYESVVMPVYPEDSDESLKRAGKTARILVNTYRENMLMVGHGHSVCGMAQGLMGSECQVSMGLCALTKIVRHHGTVNMELNGDDSHLSGGNSHRDRFN